MTNNEIAEELKISESDELNLDQNTRHSDHNINNNSYLFFYGSMVN